MKGLLSSDQLAITKRIMNQKHQWCILNLDYNLSLTNDESINHVSSGQKGTL